MTVTNNPTVPIPPPHDGTFGDGTFHGDTAREAEAAIIRDDDGNPVLDPDVNDDFVDSAEADRLAAGAAEED